MLSRSMATKCGVELSREIRFSCRRSRRSVLHLIVRDDNFAGVNGNRKGAQVLGEIALVPPV